MRPLEELVRPNIRALKPYSTARDEFSGGEITTWLDANENPYDNGVNRYPDPHQKLLKQKIAALKGVREEQVFIGNGSDEAIDLCYRIFCRPGVDNAVSIAPTYGMYRVAAAVNELGYSATKGGYSKYGEWGGSAYGGKWKPNPNKPADSRFLGEPCEIKRTFKDGYWVDTKIGDDGRAAIERHYTDHNRLWAHTNPHDHIITWDNPGQCPVPGSPSNYPNGAPEFKHYQLTYNMRYIIVPARVYLKTPNVTGSVKRSAVRVRWELEEYTLMHQNRIVLSASAISRSACIGAAKWNLSGKAPAMVWFDMDRAIRFLFMLPTGRKRSGFMIRQMKHWNTWWEKIVYAM